MNALHDRPCSVIFVWNNPPLINGCLKLADTLFSLGYSPLFLMPTDEHADMVSDAGYVSIAIAEYIQKNCLQDFKKIKQNIFIKDNLLLFKGINVTEDTWYENQCLANGTSCPLGCTTASELAMQSVIHLNAFEQLLTEVRASVCYLWNGLVYPPKALKTICQRMNIPVFSLERGLLPERLVVDPLGINYGGSLGGEDGLRLLQNHRASDYVAVETFINEFRTNKRSVVDHGLTMNRVSLYRKIGCSPNKKIILFANQIDWDTNILYYSPHYKTNIAAIKEVVAAARQLPDAFVVVKSHPEDTAAALTGLQEILGSDGVVVSDISLPTLLESAYALVVRNSTVGLEGVLLASR